MHQIGIAHVFDLRSKPEVDKGWSGSTENDAKDVARPAWIQNLEAAGVERTWVPVFKEADYSPEKIAVRYIKYMDEDVKGFVAAYEGILRDGGNAYRQIFRYLISLPPRGKNGDDAKPLGALIHCTAGKDRTGIFFGILFDFLGVPREQIAEEYNLTELGLRGVRDEVVARLMQSPGFKQYMLAKMAGKTLSADDVAKTLRTQADASNSEDAVEIPPEIIEKGRQAALRMVGARKASMLGALEMMDTNFGGAETYMKKNCGLTDEDLERLKTNLLVKD